MASAFTADTITKENEMELKQVSVTMSEDKWREVMYQLDTNAYYKTTEQDWRVNGALNTIEEALEQNGCPVRDSKGMILDA
jgi:hypothetical protein